jgi:uncharacterized protein (TIGR02001 family)
MPNRWGMRRVRAGALSLGAGVSLAVVAGSAAAADLPRTKQLPPVAVEPAPESKLIDFAFGARIATDYNFRGISQSDRSWSPQAYGELQLFDNFLYAGIAAYRVDLPTDPDAEVDLTVGIRPKWGPLTFDLGIIRYWYPGERQFFFPAGVILTPKDTDFTELAAKVSWAVDSSWTLGAGVFHTWDWLGSGAPGTYANATLKYLFPETFLPGFAISGELGYYSLGRVDAYLGGLNLKDYTYWNAGVSYTWKNITIDARYHDTDLSRSECFLNTTDPSGVFSGSGRSKWCDAAFVGTLSFDITASQLGIFAPAR